MRADPSELYSLTIGGTETFIKYPLNFNPYANLAAPRVIEQKMISGTNRQISMPCHSDGKFVISGQVMPEDIQAIFQDAYDNNPIDEMIFKSYIKDSENPEQWKVIWSSFIPVPTEEQVQYMEQQSWTMELKILVKYINGEWVS